MTVQELVAFADQVEGEGGAKIGRTASDFMCTMTIKELTAMAERLLQVPQGGTVVEIGVYCGRSASMALKLQAERDLDITLIDNWSWNAPDSKIAFWHFIEREFPNTPFTMKEMSSHEAREIWPVGKRIDFIHIDACHDYYWVEKDCAMWMQLVKVGGIAMFHDYAITEIPNYCGVTQAVDEHCSGEKGWSSLGEAQRLAIRQKVRESEAPPVGPVIEEIWNTWGRPVLDKEGIPRP